jgi:hypothetical protein
VTVEEPSTASKGDFDRLLKRNFGKLRRLRECKRSENSLAVPASFAEKLRLNIGQPGIIGPSITADCERVAAAIVSAVDQQPAHPISRISAKAIFCGRSDMSNDCADRGEDEAARDCDTTARGFGFALFLHLR